MSLPSYPSLPPLAGVCSHAAGAQPGISVDRSVLRLRRYVYLKAQSLFNFSTHFNQLPEWELKSAISLHLWQEAEHSTWFRTRITQMRTPPHNLDRVPDEALAGFVAELRASRDSLEFVTGVYDVLKRATVAALREYLADSHPLADHPTRRLIKWVLDEEEAQLEWGESALATLRQHATPAARNAADAWKTHLTAYLAFAGGIHGESPRIEIVQLPPARATTPLAPISQVPRRDDRFAHVWKSRGVVPDAARPVHERLWWMMDVRLNEMHVSELIASVIADWKGQPWEFYHDLARHLWDETRHCLLGEVAFVSQGIDITQIPTHVGFAEYPNTKLSPADRYAFLWGIEQGLMGKSGKQSEVALAKAGGDELATVFQDFDWADEVLHAAIGRRWLEPHYGDREAMLAVYDRVRPDYDRMKDEDLKKPGRDWFPSFYKKHLSSKNPNLHETESSHPEISTPSGY
ncbi:hypothetical protein [Oleiharenicola lentus]|uniref:hypothetical protein n=1 Tax=Oleiharenicola lentus TaxID=2508720 RepID=UPI003F6704FD